MNNEEFMQAGSGYGSGGFTLPKSDAETQTAKPWYQNEMWAGAVAGSVSGIFQYLNMQEQTKNQRQIYADRNAHETNTINAAVGRASRMPLIGRITKKRGK